MRTTHDQFQEVWHHDHAGARWLAPFMAVIVLMMLGLFFLLVYPHLSLSGQL